MNVSAAYENAIAKGRLKDDPAQRAALPALDRVQEAIETPVKKTGWFAKPPPAPKGLYMWGGVGRGKSMLMDLLFAQTEAPKDRQHFHAFMQWTHARMKEARERGVDDAIAPVVDELTGKMRFLAFDEMQISDITDAMIVGRLFEGLFKGGVTVVTTSNRPPDDLYKDGLNRQLFLPFIDLIKDRMEVLHLHSPNDHRQGRLAGAETYFTPLGRDSRAAIDAIWQDLTHGEDAPLTLHVNKREVEIPRFHNGAARVSFYALCGRPLGAADYLALAEKVRVLVLEDIPALGRSNFNEAKRFVTLIDALYEARVKLIASAAAQPEMLYLEGEGSFEFERTASRLREMQADGWGEGSGGG